MNNITGEESICRPHNSFGGIIADVMGLGKTLTAIALVASDKDALNASFIGSGVSTTLVVVRAPCRSDFTAILTIKADVLHSIANMGNAITSVRVGLSSIQGLVETQLTRADILSKAQFHGAFITAGRRSRRKSASLVRT